MIRRVTLLERWGAFAVRKRWYVLGASVVVVVFLALAARSLNEGTVSSLDIPGAESQEAVSLLEDAFPQRSGDYGDIVLYSPNGISDPGSRAVIDTLVANVSSVSGVTSVASPFAPQSGLLSADGTTGIVRVQFSESADQVPTEQVDGVEAAMAAAAEAGLQVEFGGPVASAQEHEGPNESTVLGLIAAFVILYVLFRTLVPTALPVGTALFGLAAGFAAVFAMTSVVELSKFGPNIAAMLGLGVGIDYALFIVARHRENVARGMSIEAAAGTALATAGKSVIFAGVVVITSLLGLSFMGIPFVGWIGVAAALMVALAVLVAIVLLPALLGLAGTRILSLKGRRRTEPDLHHEGSPWYALGQRIMRRPYVFFGLSTLVLLVLSIPLLDIRLGSADAGNNPTSSTTRRAYDLTAEAFGPGANGPLQIVVDAGSEAELQQLQLAISDEDGVASVGQALTSPDGRLTIFSVIPESAPQDAATTELVHRLRDETIPGAMDGSDADVYIAGTTARYIDIADRIGARLPLFFAIVVGISFLLLTMVFRSLVIAFKAALMNLLSIGAAYGVVVAVFEWGWLLDLTGADKTGPVESFLPMMLFAVLFGLSMDYEVFLVSRIREEYLRTKDNAQSVAHGLASTASVITAAATIMIVVFLSFVLNDQRVVKEFGLGLAVAVFVDATVVRLLLVPATMQLMGN
ncbi:MAG: MMPL family transporter, partial [Chloroflexi bacterium]|nr:MMPL family transporter [Chloroflexota bacterium]